MPSGPAASPTPSKVIEQFTYLLFLKRLDDLHTLEENKSTRLKKPMERRVFPEGNDPKGRLYDDCRWLRFKHFQPYNLPHAVKAAALFRALRADTTSEPDDRRPVIINDLKILAQAEEESIPVILTWSEQSLTGSMEHVSSFGLPQRWLSCKKKRQVFLTNSE